MKLHIFGASGAGVTTLGQALSAMLGVAYFDSDAYFWEISEPPFTVRRPAAARNTALVQALAQHQSWIVGGSIVGWDEQWLSAFDLVVFLWIPPELRLQRLRQRETQRYGMAILADETRAEQYRTFLAWAAGYDDNTSGGSRTLVNHTNWLTRFTCPVLELRGDLSMEQRVHSVLAKLQALRH